MTAGLLQTIDESAPPEQPERPVAPPEKPRRSRRARRSRWPHEMAQQDPTRREATTNVVKLPGQFAHATIDASQIPTAPYAAFTSIKRLTNEPRLRIVPDTPQQARDESPAPAAQPAQPAQPAPERRRRRRPSTQGLLREPAGNATDGDSIAPATGLDSALETLYQSEIARTRRLTPMLAALMIGSFCIVPLLGGDPLARLAFQIGLGVSLVGTLWLRYLLSEPSRLTPGKLACSWVMQLCTLCTAQVYFGVFSPAPICMILAVYFLGLSHYKSISTGVAMTLLTFYVGASLLITTGVIAHRGLVHVDYLTATQQYAGLALVIGVIATAFFLARASRTETLAAFERLRRAARAIAQRDAMMMEARQDLKRAMRIGGPGVLSGQIVGSFELGVLVGRGGMGEVYKARHIKTDETAAVKVLQSGLLHRPACAARFKREVQIASSLDVPNVVRVLEVGGEDSALPFLAMEFLNGKSLAHFLRTHRRLSPAHTARMVRDVGRGIHAAGQAGIVHRDLKPQNLFLAEGPDGKHLWKVLDFGVSTIGPSSGTLTQGRVVGTPAYMSPEQARGQAVNHRADLYALAAIAYRSLTGHPPFRGEDLPSLLHDVVYATPRQPSKLAELPPEVDAVLAIGMAKSPDDRFACADEFADALDDAIRGVIDPALHARAGRLIEAQPWR